MNDKKSTYSGVEGEPSTITYSKNLLTENDFSFLTDFLVKKIDKENGKRRKLTATIESNTKQAIYEGLMKHFPDDFEIDFYFASFNHKYFLTDKGHLFSITPFFRGHTNEEKQTLALAQKKFDAIAKWHDIDKLKKDENKMAKEIL